VLNPEFIQTDGRGRVVLPWHPNMRYLMRENEDGSILQPATAVTVAQQEFQSTPELLDLLARATAAPTVRRVRLRRG
jgi:hypothetical protein